MATSIKGIEGMAPGELRHQIELGGRFVFYKYTISVVVITFRRNSDIYFVKPGENRVVKGLGWTLLTLLLGWWGIPWGPIYSVGSLWTNLRGGEDVTLRVVNTLNLDQRGPVGGAPNMMMPPGNPPPSPSP